MSRFSRSQFLAIAGAAVLAPAVEYVRPALADVVASKLSDIDHIVILLQENRSFDHYFGSLAGVRGFGDVRPPLLPNGRPVFYQPDPFSRDGYLLPFHLDTKTTSAQRLHDLSHSWSAQHATWDGGRVDDWVGAHRQSDGTSGPLTMGYYTRADLPFHYALADAFTICDGYHCSLMGPTNPNRYYWMSATIDPDGTHGGPATNNRGRRYTWETYPQRLERAGVSWRIYRPQITARHPIGLAVIMNFAAFQDAPQTSGLYENAVKGRSVGTLLADIRTGNLPAVSWIVPPYELCEHPDMLPAAGEDFIRQILEAFWSNPRLWAHTAFVISYDENDGLFDHVPPPTPPAGTPGEFVDGVPIGLGFRVPCLVLSPFSRGAYVCGDTFDHTSTLRLVEARFGVEIPNLTAWRRETCGDLTSAFGFGDPADTSIPSLPQTAGELLTVEREVATLPPPAPPSVQSMPKPEVATVSRRRRGGARAATATAFMATALALAGCGGNGGVSFAGQGSCLFSGVTQLIYPIPNATNVPDALSQIVFATSQLFPYSFDVLINTSSNPNLAKSGSSAFFQRIASGQVPSPSAAPTLSNPYYESAALSATFPHGTYYVFLNDSQVSCTPTNAGSFTTQ